MKKILLILPIFFAVIMAKSQVQTNSELQSLINQSFSYFPNVKEAENNISSALAKLDIAQNNQPIVDGSATYNYVQPKILLPIYDGTETKDFQFAAVHNGNANISASYLLFDFGKIKANVERAKTDLQFAQHNVEYVKSQLANQVANIYYNIIYLQKAIVIEDSGLAYLNENKRIIESKLANGDALKIDLLNIQAGVDEEENRKLDLQNSLQKQLNLLWYTTGKQTTSGYTFDFDVILKDALNALTDAQTNNLEYVLARDRVQQAQNDLGIIKTNDKPSVSLGGNAGFKNGYVPAVNEMRFNYAAGVSLKIPIYDGGKVKKQTKLAETAIRQNELAIQTMNNNYRKDIQQSLTDINSNIERIKHTEGQITETQAAQDLATSRYKYGVGTYLEITNASTNKQKAEFTRLQYEYQLCLAKVQLARVLGYQYW